MLEINNGLLAENSDISVSVDAKRLAFVQSFSAKTEKALLPLWSFGESTPSAIACGRKVYKIEITRQLVPGDEVDFSAQEVFSLGVYRDGTTVAYYIGCQCESVETRSVPGKPDTEIIHITAANEVS